MWVYLLVAAVGLVVPLLAAAYPVWKGSGVSVREAMDDYGLTVNLGRMYPFEQVERATRNTPGALQAEGWLTVEGFLPDAATANSGGGHMRGGSYMHDGGWQGAGAVGDGGAASGGRFSVVGVPVETSC